MLKVTTTLFNNACSIELHYINLSINSRWTSLRGISIAIAIEDVTASWIFV